MDACLRESDRASDGTNKTESRYVTFPCGTCSEAECEVQRVHLRRSSSPPPTQRTALLLMSLLVQTPRADRVLQSTTCMYRNFTTIASIDLEQELMPKLPMACDLKPAGWEPK